jgi:purine nucleosidase
MKKLLSLLVLISMVFAIQAQEKRRVILDADTANEVDDLYAIVRGLIEPTWEVVGLNATQWQISQWATARSMEDSHRLNDVLVSYLNMGNRVTLNRGAEGRLYDWGVMSRPSAASRFIINEAHKMPEGKKITVIALGSLTNVASAIMEDPSIIDKIELHWLGSSYDFEQGIMTNLDFNSMMDIRAFYTLINSRVEMHIIPSNEAARMRMEYAETVRHFQGQHDLLDFLIQIWFNHFDSGREWRTIWDLALIQAIIHPDMAEKTLVRTSREKGNREVWMYRNIDARRMTDEFYKTTVNHLKGR